MSNPTAKHSPATVYPDLRHCDIHTQCIARTASGVILSQHS